MNTEKKIKEIMTVNLISVREWTGLKKILDLFYASTIHHILVTDKEGKLTGIISKEDLLRFYSTVFFNTAGKKYSEKSFDHTFAKDIMTPNPITIDPDDHIGLAADIFYANQFRALPVVELDDLLGIVTPYDLLKYAYSDVQVGNAEKEELREMRD